MSELVRIRRFSVVDRLFHFFLVLTFLTQCLTGMGRLLFTTNWGKWLVGLFGGYESAYTIHNRVGIFMLLLFAAHIGYALSRVDWRSPFKSLFGPDSLLVLGGSDEARAIGQREKTITLEDVKAVEESFPGTYITIPMTAVPSKVEATRGYGGEVIQTADDLLASLASSVPLVPALASQTPQVLWWHDLQAPSFGSSATADIDADGKLEIVFGTYFNDETIYALNAEDGSTLWSYDTGGCNDASPVICDVDLDGKLEVVVPASSPCKVFCFDGATGSIEWQISTGTSSIDSPPAVADVDETASPRSCSGPSTATSIA